MHPLYIQAKPIPPLVIVLVGTLFLCSERPGDEQSGRRFGQGFAAFDHQWNMVGLALPLPFGVGNGCGATSLGFRLR